MSIVSIVTRDKDEQGRFESVNLTGVDTVAPFGASAVALSTDTGTVILPLGRIRSIFIQGDSNDGEEQQQVITQQRS